MGSVTGRTEGRGLPLSPAAGWTAAGWAVALSLAVALPMVVAAEGEPLRGDLRLTGWAQDLPVFHTIARTFRWGMGTEGVIVVGVVVASALALAKHTTEAIALLAALLVL